MAYQSIHTGTDIDNGISINSTQNDRLTNLENKSNSYLPLSGGTMAGAINMNDADLCRYGLVLDDNSRIIDAPVKRYAPADAIIVNKLPEGDYHDYLYIDGEYVYDPLPEPDPEPTPTLEDRVEALETTSDDIILMMAELIGG